MEFKDYYKTLGVTRAATTADIKKAFRKQARQHHPDLNPGDAAAAETFKELNEAHEVLSDPDKRRKYDQFGRHWKQAQQSGGGFPGHDPFGPGTPFDGGSGFRWTVRGGPDGQSSDPTSGPAFSDFFRSIFGNEGHAPFAAGTRRPGPARGEDLEHLLELTIEEAWHGTKRRLSFQSPTGGAPRSVEVKIPAGVKPGARVRVAGQGQPGRGRPAGRRPLSRDRHRPAPPVRAAGAEPLRARHGPARRRGARRARSRCRRRPGRRSASRSRRAPNPVR